VWLDKWEIRSWVLIPLKIQRGLEKSNILLMCMSSAYFDSERGNMEHLTIPFRNPTNTQRRLIPLLFNDCTIPDTISQFAYIDWRTWSDESYEDILASCSESNSELSFPIHVEQKQKEEAKMREEKEEFERKKSKIQKSPEPSPALRQAWNSYWSQPESLWWAHLQTSLAGGMQKVRLVCKLYIGNGWKK
jgi:TIR domain